jgi:hypothetical protein
MMSSVSVNAVQTTKEVGTYVQWDKHEFLFGYSIGCGFLVVLILRFKSNISLPAFFLGGPEPSNPWFQSGPEKNE